MKGGELIVQPGCTRRSGRRITSVRIGVYGPAKTSAAGSKCRNKMGPIANATRASKVVGRVSVGQVLRQLLLAFAVERLLVYVFRLSIVTLVGQCQS